MIYKCEFPKCSYQTQIKNKIHFHHIIPKELSGNNDKKNLIKLCPNCHSKIFIPNSQKGNHSIKDKDSIVIINRLKSGIGTVLKYKKMDEKEYIYFYETKEEMLA